MKHSCSCCNPAKSYTELRNLYAHERHHNPNFVEPAIRQRVAYESDPIMCECCQIPLTFKQYIESKKAGKYCSKSCAAKVNNLTKHWRQKHGKLVEAKQCIECGNLIKFGSKYCSSECQHSFKYKAFIKDWLDGKVKGQKGLGGVSVPIRRYLIEQAGNKCSKCGWNEIHPITGRVPLTVDHIDGDSENNVPENLKVLCPNCHSLTPTYGNLNKGNGRTSRTIRRHKMKQQGIYID